MLEEYEKIQPIAFQIMINTIKKNRLSHAYLIETNDFSKKKEFVFAFAKYLLCPSHHIEKDENCSICSHNDFENMLDIKWIQADGMWIKKEQLEEVQHAFMKTAIAGNKKIYVIEDASRLNSSAANSILKFLEEPEDNIIAILMVDNMYQVLPTILSRCQIIHLKQDENYSLFFPLEMVDAVYHFIDYIENYKMEALLHENKIWMTHFTKPQEVEEALTILMYFYKDLLNIIISRKLEKFSSYQKELEKIARMNTLESICMKIDIIREKIEQMQVNINLNLLIDDLIIQFSEV